MQDFNILIIIKNYKTFLKNVFFLFRMDSKFSLALLLAGSISCISPEVSELERFIDKNPSRNIAYLSVANEISEVFPSKDQLGVLDTIVYYSTPGENKKNFLREVEQVYHSQIGPMKTAIYDRWTGEVTEIDCGPNCPHTFAERYNPEFMNRKIAEESRLGL